MFNILSVITIYKWSIYLEFHKSYTNILFRKHLFFLRISFHSCMHLQAIGSSACWQYQSPYLVVNFTAWCALSLFPTWSVIGAFVLNLTLILHFTIHHLITILIQYTQTIIFKTINFFTIKYLCNLVHILRFSHFNIQG